MPSAVFLSRAMKIELRIPCGGGKHASIRLDGDNPLLRGMEMAALMGLEACTPDPDVSPAVDILELPGMGDALFSMHAVSVRWNRASLGFDINIGRRKSTFTSSQLGDEWQNIVICAAIAAQMRGHQMLACHGALLEGPRGGMLLCGESGVGKSTAATRWMSAGGTCNADDMCLLEFEESGIYARPLPTWSRCRKGIGGLCYPVGHRVKLVAAVALSRSGGEQGGMERLEDAPAADATAQFYRSAMYFPLSVLPWLEDRDQRKVAAHAFRLVGRLMATLPPKVFFACLEGDIMAALGGCLL